MRVLEAFVKLVGVAACWIFVPGQIVISTFHIVGRRVFHFSGTPLQELEWHFVVALIFLALGLAYISDRHVRIDILREKLSVSTRCRIEIAGFFLTILPFCLIVIYFGSEYAWNAYEIGERSRAALGLPYRWIIKSVVPVGALLLLLGGMVVTWRNFAVLRNPSPNG